MGVNLDNVLMLGKCDQCHYRNDRLCLIDVDSFLAHNKQTHHFKFTSGFCARESEGIWGWKGLCVFDTDLIVRGVRSHFVFSEAYNWSKMCRSLVGKTYSLFPFNCG